MGLIIFFSDNKDCLWGLIFILDGILCLFISWLFTDIFELENVVFFCHQLIFLISFFFIHEIFFLSCLKGFYLFRDLNRLLILHVTWSRCLMRFKVLVILLLFIFICIFLTLEMITLAIINHIFWWTLEQRSCTQLKPARLQLRCCTSGTYSATVLLWELILLFIKLIFDIYLLIVFLIYKISSFFFILALGLVFQDFRLGLSLLFFIIDFVISSLNLNIMLHAFFQKTFIIKGFQHLQ